MRRLLNNKFYFNILQQIASAEDCSVQDVYAQIVLEHNEGRTLKSILRRLVYTHPLVTYEVRVLAYLNRNSLYSNTININLLKAFAFKRSESISQSVHFITTKSKLHVMSIEDIICAELNIDVHCFDSMKQYTENDALDAYINNYIAGFNTSRGTSVHIGEEINDSPFTDYEPHSSTESHDVAEEPKTIPNKIGAEIEFWSKYNLSGVVVSKYKVIPEYYSGMFELNNFLADFNSASDIYKFFTKIVKTVNDITEVCKERNNTLQFNTIGHKIDDRSMVFNGLHIHLSLGEASMTKAFANNLKRSACVPHFKLNNYPSIRSFYSHHIWGKYREYDSNYKSRDKFKPVIFVPKFNTCEIRIFDNEDILVKTRRKALSKFLWKIVQDTKQGKEFTDYSNSFPTLLHGEDTDALLHFCKTKLKGKQNKYKIMRNKVITPSKQMLEFSEDYIKLTEEIV